MKEKVLSGAQKEMLVGHIWQLHTAGKINWSGTIRDTSFRAQLETGAKLFVSVYIQDGKVYSMPCNVEVNNKDANIDGNDPRLIKIGQELAEEWILPKALAEKDILVLEKRSVDRKSDPDQFLREVGVSVDPIRRDNRISEVIGVAETGIAGIVSRIRRLFQ